MTAGYQHQLTGLEAATLYQVFVVSENQQGSSLPDVTILFVTEGTILVIAFTVISVLSGHSKIDKTKVLKANGSLMKVKSIAECSLGAFCNTFDLH